MIVDTSALMAVILGEPDAEHVLSLMSRADELGVSAATLVEAGIVAEAKGGREAADDLMALLTDLECVVVPLDQDQTVLAVEAWRRFGNGRHPAALNLGDCFSYAAAKSLGRPLLFKGGNFAQTDISAATHAAKSLSRAQGISLGRAVSEIAMRGLAPAQGVSDSGSKDASDPPFPVIHGGITVTDDLVAGHRDG